LPQKLLKWAISDFDLQGGGIKEYKPYREGLQVKGGRKMKKTRQKA
jgi:hypothetical protein